MGLKDAYYGLEDKWYGLLDKVNSKLPVYRVVEPVDKVVPSFLLFLAIVAILALWGFTLFAIPAGSSLSIEVFDQDGTPIEGATVLAVAAGEEVFSGTTNGYGEVVLGSVALEQELELTISGEGFETYTETYLPVAGNILKKVFMEETEERNISILLKDEYNQPVREPLTLHFSCRNPDAQAPASITVSSGQATVKEPGNCNGLIVRVDADGFESVSSRELSGESETIYLQEVVAEEGTIRVELRFNGTLVDESETVYLYRDNGLDGSGPIDSESTSTGVAEFVRSSGSYFVKTSGSGVFGVAESPVFSLASGDAKTIALELEENIVGEVKIRVLEKGSSNAIEDARVVIKLGAEDAAPAKYTDSEGEVVFPVSRDTDYTAAIDSEDYCFTTKKVGVSSNYQIIELEPYTAECGGVLKVKVLDQDGSLVKNSVVSLHNEDGFTLGFENRTSDANGLAEFKGVRSGNYKAFAFKGSSSGWSETEHFIERSSAGTILTVVLTVPDGTVKVRVLDRDGVPLQFAQVAFVEVEDNQAIGGGALPVEDMNGTVEFTTKADKKIYIVASKSGYANFTSVVYDVLPSTVQEITAVLEKEIISGEIEAEFLEMVNETGRTVLVLAQGQEYTAKLQLRIPSNSSYRRIGMHLRVGDKKIMELDKIVVKELNVPGNASIVKATSFDSANGYDVDSQFVTSDEAKWANIGWTGFATGVLSVEARVRVKETAGIEDELHVYYRAWAETQSKVLRDPEDTALGDSAGVAESLYANTHKEIFQIGTETVCDEKFCFSATLLDLTEDLAESVNESFSAKIFRDYKLNFNILNSSEHETDSYVGAEIRILNENEGLLFNEYSIYGAQGENRVGNAGESEIGWIPIGDLNPNEAVSASLNFTPQKTGSAPLVIQVRAGQRIQFSQTISANVQARKRFDVVVTPELLPSGIENKLTVAVKEISNTLEVKDAKVKVKDKFGDIIAQKTTNSKGIAVLTLPAMHPGEKLFLFVEKFDFEVFERELNVDEKIVSIKPDRIGVALNAKTTPETEDGFRIENRTDFDVTIESLELKGRFRGLLDDARIANWLFGFEGEKIEAGQENEYSLKTFLSEAGKRISTARNFEGELIIAVSAYQSVWEFTIPVAISIGLGGEVDEPTCFNILRKEWKGFTEGNPIEIEFEVQNNCSVESTPVTLRDIEAKVQWQGNPIGQFELRTEQAAIDLRSGYFRRFSPELLPGESIAVVLSFTPHAGIDGTAKADIAFQASNPTDTVTQVLTDKLSAEIVSTNLVDCIYFDRDVVSMAPGKTAKFTVETLGCGDATTLNFESDLTVTPDKLVMKSKDKKDIEVLAEKNMPGQYPIKVFAQGLDQVENKLINTLRARITSGKCIDLSKYEFDVFDNPDNPYDGYDTAELENNCYNKPVTINIKFDEKSWSDAAKDGFKMGLMMGIAGMALGYAKMGTGTAGLNKWWGPIVGPGMVKDAADAKVSMKGKEVVRFMKPDGELVIGYYEKDGKTFISKDGTEYYEPGKIKGWTEIEAEAAKKEKKEGETPAAKFLLAGDSGLGSLGGGMLQNLMGGATGLLGAPSLVTWGGAGFVMGTLFAYNQQEEGSVSYTRIMPDLYVDEVLLLMPAPLNEEGKLQEAPSEGISAQLLEETYLEPRQDNSQLARQFLRTGFVNDDKIVQPDPATPLYRMLRVDSFRREYRTEYEVDEKGDIPPVQQTGTQPHVQRFRLQFNSFHPTAIDQKTPPIPNCRLGNKVGVTGKNALPKIKFDWSWASIGDNACDEGNDEYIYCDATQFSIEVLKKVEKLKEFIESNKPFDCPSPGSAKAVKEQQIVGTAYDVAVTKIQAMKASGDANVMVVVESNNGKKMDARLAINLKNKGSGALVKSCTRDFELMSRSVESCLFTGVTAGTYNVEAVLLPELCAGCENSDEDNDSIEVELSMGDLGVVECYPYRTTRLPQFIEATEIAGNATWSQAEKDEVLGLLKFNAHFIKDAYTNDFRQDFHEFCTHKSFFDCPEYYLQGDGLGEYFSSEDRFVFDYAQAPHAPIDAGKYEVTLDIEFDNENWQFFSNGEPDATINVRFAQLSAPEPNSPFYYLPFDGMVGVDSANGRQGYGTNFRQTSQETIKVNNSTTQMITSTNVASSTPIYGGWINTGFSDSFRTLNIDKRGILLDVQQGADDTSVVLSPSYATPIMMNISYAKGEEAYGFYSVEIDQGPQTAFTRMIPWSGIGVNCRDFSDAPVTEAWDNSWDTHGGITGNIRCARGTDIEHYGIEWCNPIRQGEVFLESVVFTPQGTSSLMQRGSYGDEMTLIGVDNAGSQIALNGVPGMEFNSYGTSTIDSIEDVFGLVEQGLVCLIGADNRISNQFFWNPKTVLEEMAGQRDQAEQECIKFP